MDTSRFLDAYRNLFGDPPRSVSDSAWSLIAQKIEPRDEALVFKRIRDRCSRSSASSPRPHAWLDVIESVARDRGERSQDAMSPEFRAAEAEIKKPLFHPITGIRLRPAFMAELPEENKKELARIRIAVLEKGTLRAADCKGLITAAFDVSLSDYPEREQAAIRRAGGRVRARPDPKFTPEAYEADRAERRDPDKERIEKAFGVEGA